MRFQFSSCLQRNCSSPFYQQSYSQISTKCLVQEHTACLVHFQFFKTKSRKFLILVRNLSANAYIILQFNSTGKYLPRHSVLGLASQKFFFFSNIFQWGKPVLPVKQFLETYMLNVFYFLCHVLYKFQYSFMLQDEDADFLAKLAKLIAAAGTQLLNSYNK